MIFLYKIKRFELIENLATDCLISILNLNVKLLNFNQKKEDKFLELKRTPLISASPLMPNVSANDRRVEICSSNTFTSPEYMKVSKATMDPNVAPEE